MQERDVQVFVEGTQNYFQEVSGVTPEIGLPYLKGEEEAILDYTGAIGISGERKGCVYFTTNREMLAGIVQAVVGSEEEVTEESLRDMVGEIANTISGNARRSFGSNFMISVPIVIVGSPVIDLPMGIPTYVIPLTWQGHKSYIVAGIE
ncbi:MAG: chemotaxis protein CheX [bacterium]|nr:chemotaxis protein CheX [bacterium]